MTFKRGQLRAFVAVADEGQFTRAAGKLHIAQPALSQAIAQLEAELGIELLVRHARGATLTDAGRAFLPKARSAVAKEKDAALTAQALARAARGVVAVGFIGTPPTIDAPELFTAFADAHPGAEFSFHDLSFPRGATVSWLGEVDVAFCHRPAIVAGVRAQTYRLEPRAVVVHKDHALTRRKQLAVADVLDETFVSYHPDVQRTWAGFHSFDDHRGGPPEHLTNDRVATPLQILGKLGLRRAITAIPLSDALVAERVIADATAIPVEDAAPASLSLIWRMDNHNPLVPALAAFAECVKDGG